VVLVAVPHSAYGELSDGSIARMIAEGGLLADLKNLYKERDLPGVGRWSL
jgi:hypothetical protein